MDALSNDIVRHVLTFDKHNYLNVAHISKRYRELYTSTCTDINVIMSMVYDSVYREDIALFTYVYDSYFLHEISRFWTRKFEEIFEYMIRKDKLKLLKHFHIVARQDFVGKHIHYPCMEFILDWICYHGRVEMMEYIITDISYTEFTCEQKDELMRSSAYKAALYGQVNIINYIYKERELNSTDAYVIVSQAMTMNHLRVIDWAYRRNKENFISKNDVLKVGAQTGFLDIVLWAHSYGLINTQQHLDIITKNAIIHGHTRILTWMYDTFGRMGNDVWLTATTYLKLDMMEFIHKNYDLVDTTNYYLYLHILFGRIHSDNEDVTIQCLDWLKGHNVVITHDVFMYLNLVSSNTILEWFIQFL